MLVLGSAMQLAAAAMVKPDVFMSPDPLVKLQAIRRSGRGWVLQAVLFPLAFAVVTTGFGMLARRLGGLARGWATTATALSALSTLLWLPMTRGRLTVGREVDQMIRQHQPGIRVDISGGGGWAFWPYTGAALTSVATVSAALTVSRLAQKTGIGVLLASTLIPAVAITRWRDWPPFATYLCTTIIGLSLVFQPGSASKWKRSGFP
jgi:hypothetical protein